MISNLIDNALHYTQSGGCVTVTVAHQDGVMLSVEDNGPGIPASEHERIFERFYRIPGTSGDGCGLGLSIVRDIARIHDARIAIATGHDGTGTCFRLHFPVPSHY
jgi:two-component system sensor histidine kinase TctE